MKRDAWNILQGICIGLLIAAVLAILLTSCAPANRETLPPAMATEQSEGEPQPLSNRWIEKVDCNGDLCVYALRGKYVIACYIAVYDTPRAGSNVLQMDCP